MKKDYDGKKEKWKKRERTQSDSEMKEDWNIESSSERGKRKKERKKERERKRE